MRDTSKKTDLVTFRLSRAALIRIERVCESEDRSRSYVVRKLVEKGLALRAERPEPRVRPGASGKA